MWTPCGHRLLLCLVEHQPPAWLARQKKPPRDAGEFFVQNLHGLTLRVLRSWEQKEDLWTLRKIRENAPVVHPL